MGWVIYISGFILTYLFCKWLRNKKDNNNWEDVGITIIASLFSWVMVIVVGVIGLVETIKVKNPPKWL